MASGWRRVESRAIALVCFVLQERTRTVRTGRTERTPRPHYRFVLLLLVLVSSASRSVALVNA